MTIPAATPSATIKRTTKSLLFTADRTVGRFFEWGEARFGIYNGALLYLFDYSTVPMVLFGVPAFLLGINALADAGRSEPEGEFMLEFDADEEGDRDE